MSAAKPKHRFYIPVQQVKGDHAFIYPPEYHHLVDVLRYQEGDIVVLFNGRGDEFRGEIISLNKNNKEVRLKISRIASWLGDRRPLVLVQGLIKSAKMDFIIEKAAELGVTHILPVVTEHCVIRLDQRQKEKKLQKWHRIIIEAAKQCGLKELPLLDMIWEFKHAVRALSWVKDRYICTLQEVTKRTTVPPAESSAAVLIGPEGGFSPSEVEFALTNGWQALSLGKNRLRAETAAIVALGTIAQQSGFWE